MTMRRPDTPGRPPQPQRSPGAPEERPAPKRVRGGIKLNAPEGDVLQLTDDQSRPVVRAWLATLQPRFSAEAWHEGMQFARSGQVMRLEFVRGGIEALVQGRRPRPQTVYVSTPCFDEATWTSLVQAMSTETLHLATLLAGRLPVGLDESLAALERTLIATTDEPIEVRVDDKKCADELGVAACMIAAQMLASDPMLAFRLRGLPVDRLLDRLREARDLEAHGVSTAHRQAAPDDSLVRTAAPLEACLDDYWGTNAALNEVRHTPPPHHIPHALLRRLGPSPLSGKFPLVGLLASIYDTVAEHAREVLDGGGGDDVGAEQDS